MPATAALSLLPAVILYKWLRCDGWWPLQIPSQLVAERVGLPYWIGFLMVGWGITATLMAGLTSSPTHLYLLRFFLGQLATPNLTIPSVHSVSC